MLVSNYKTKFLLGEVVAQNILQHVKQEVAMLKNRPPCVVFIRVGNDGASISYVNKKTQKAEFCGIKSIVKLFDIANTTETDLIQEIDHLNRDNSVDGILVQAPLPNNRDFVKVVGHIAPQKDVDGFCALNSGYLQQNRNGIIPCTPAGIIEILKFYKIPVQGKHVVIVNRSLIVGKPLAALFLKNNSYGNATVTVCHSYSENLEKITQQADILVLACGRPHFFDQAFIKKGAIVIDVGITRVPANNAKGYVLQGDANIDNLQGYVSAITPVPGGVGPMTVAMLMKNTLDCYKLCHQQI